MKDFREKLESILRTINRSALERCDEYSLSAFIEKTNDAPKKDSFAYELEFRITRKGGDEFRGHLTSDRDREADFLMLESLLVEPLPLPNTPRELFNVLSAPEMISSLIFTPDCERNRIKVVGVRCGIPTTVLSAKVLAHALQELWSVRETVAAALDGGDTMDWWRLNCG
ncbi:MAG TPA: hypothetical protein VF773_02240 [Verrucomicrobiae bacterium]